MRAALVSVFFVFPVLDTHAQPENGGEAADRPQTYTVRLEKDRIIFKGIDHPSITADRPGDKYLDDSPKRGRYNYSMGKRCGGEADKAVAELRAIVKNAETLVLLNSLRSGFDGHIDYQVSLFGNRVITEELSTRRPLPQKLVTEFDANAKRVFRGVSAPNCRGMEHLLDMAAKRIESRKRRQ
ncbi:MAG: hypothetical protein HQ567_10530 [Candidatus Nealsonbacteria bacterium]|nr:hypothetical protein [Candidatus Nealsonbacteria bacterium]